MGAFWPWPAVVGFGLFLVWSVVVVRELVRSGRPFTVRAGRLSLEVGTDRTDEA
jgi:hypothetical protein